MSNSLITNTGIRCPFSDGQCVDVELGTWFSLLEYNVTKQV